jgi:hypothetical protein
MFYSIFSSKGSFYLASVTSRSGALRKLILLGHLLASDLDYYDIKTFFLDYDAL